MPKMKTKKSVRKRFRKTASGKLMHARPFRGHLLAGKSTGRKRRLRKSCAAASVESKRLRHLI